MDLIPADVILEIFHELPFKDRVRLRGVNRLFRDVSEKSIRSMRSLVITDDLAEYSISTKISFSSILESCSLILQSIDASNRLRNKWLLETAANFYYPNLKHLKLADIHGGLGKIMISRCGKLRSVSLHLSHQFIWPEDNVLEKVETLKILPSDNISDKHKYIIDLSPTLRPLIGKVPNLKHLTIKSRDCEPIFKLSVEEISRLLATAPCLKELNFYLAEGYSSDDSANLDFAVEISAWRLPNLISLVIDLAYDVQSLSISSYILDKFPISFPRLESFTTSLIEEMFDQEDICSILALSQMEHLRELRLPYLGMADEKFMKIVQALPSINLIEIAGGKIHQSHIGCTTEGTSGIEPASPDDDTD